MPGAIRAGLGETLKMYISSSLLFRVLILECFGYTG